MTPRVEASDSDDGRASVTVDKGGEPDPAATVTDSTGACPLTPAIDDLRTTAGVPIRQTKRRLSTERPSWAVSWTR